MSAADDTEPTMTPPRADRQWARSAQTRGAALDAARDVFLEMGFAAANITEIVQRSGVSVGSIYHHFGGKAELFIALWERFEEANREGARDAVAARREGGENDPLELFLAGSRAYIETTWVNRKESTLFLAGDTPAGFELLLKKDVREWVQKNSAVVGGQDEPFHRVQAMALTSIIGDAAAEISTLEDRTEVDKVIEATLELLRKVAS